MSLIGPPPCHQSHPCVSTPQAGVESSQALSEMEHRHRDIVSLESSIEELADIWRHIAALLESQVTCGGKGRCGGDSLRNVRLTVIPSNQGELVDNIERNVTSAAEYVEVSGAETNKAVWYKKNPYKIFRRTNQKPSH